MTPPLPSFARRLRAFNERVARLGTEAFSSIWAFYAFLVWGLLGMLPGVNAAFKEFVLLVSSAWIQLWALPLLMVGNAVLNKAGERRAMQDHQMLLAELKLLKRQMAELHALHGEILELVARLRQEGAPTPR
ncbi:hypothetical protein [Mesoterricola sediminis]|uniref:DUF1003 domain-containing protein n=1 Tax=Mesoterricola sediminis TaxID=2927980 RepID=A0AA48GVC4_9BACT|nr:hypothetical protein [Mesoterricola sediminis]BDU75075.1 hypothetical protein METESE_00330 [Mesoterricola sediminis]